MLFIFIKKKKENIFTRDFENITVPFCIYIYIAIGDNTTQRLLLYLVIQIPMLNSCVKTNYFQRT